MNGSLIVANARRAARRIFPAVALLCALSSAAFAATVSGTVTNGTTGKPAAGIQVILIQLQGTMQPVADTKTDAQGHYTITSDMLGTAPMLLRAVYRGVNYHEALPPGKTSADVDVYEPTDKTASFSITAHAIILQPNGTDLTVGEEFNITNNTQPPVAYYRAGGSFTFSLPADAQLTDVSAAGAAGMAVVQTTMDKGNGVKAIDFPFRPGNSMVRITYHVPYPGNSTTLKTSSPYTSGNVAYFAPPSVSVSAPGFNPAGQAQGYNAYLRNVVPADTLLTASISGTAPPPAPQNEGGAQGGAGDAQGATGDGGGSGAPAASITAMPARLDSLKWILVAGFGAIFLLGAAFVLRRPQPLMVSAPQAPAIPEVQPARVADLDQAVSSSLEQLKDGLFRLELRRQAGTITTEDYARERQRIDQRLRDLVQG